MAAGGAAGVGSGFGGPTLDEAEGGVSQRARRLLVPSRGRKQMIRQLDLWYLRDGRCSQDSWAALIVVSR